MKLLLLALAFVAGCSKAEPDLAHDTNLFNRLNLGGSVGSFVNNPTGIVFMVHPFEDAANRAAGLLRNGDTLVMQPDGRKHYWSGPLIFPGVSNITATLNMKFCSGYDGADCDIVDFWSLMDMDIWEETRIYQP